MQTTVEETDQHVVRLSVQVEPEEFARDLDRTYRRLACQAKIPGFRKGKVPKQIIDARIGREQVLHEFVRDADPAYHYHAVRDNDPTPIAEPGIDVAEV